MARKRSLDDGPVLRAQLMDESARLFHRNGFAATSIRDIADAVGISSSTMYHHFTNKQEILHAILSRFMHDFVGVTADDLTDTALTPTERIRRTVRTHLVFSQQRRVEMLVGNPIRTALAPDQRDEAIGLQVVYHDRVRDTIADGARSGEFRVADVEITTMAVLDMLNGVREWFRDDGPKTIEQVADLYAVLVLELLGVSAAPA
jgi:AcrR family transcriptional regulator